MKPELKEDLHEFIRVLLDPGFLDCAEIEADVADWAADRSIDAQRATAYVHEAWDRRRVVERSWRDTGDFGRLSAAFGELGALGVLGRMNFTCCATTALTRIADERVPGQWAYVLFDEQEAGLLADVDPDNHICATLGLTFGTFDAAGSSADAKSMLAVTIVDALVRQGLDVSWSGDPSDRIRIRISEWRKPHGM